MLKVRLAPLRWEPRRQQRWRPTKLAVPVTTVGYWGVLTGPAPAGGGGTIVPVIRATSATVLGAGSGNNIVVTKPTGTVDGDLMIGYMGGSKSSASSVSELTPPAGWTTLQEFDAGTPGSIQMGLYYKVASSEGASFTFVSAGTVNRQIAGVITIQTGTFDAGTPIDTSSLAAETGAPSTTVNAPGVTVTNTHALGLFIYVVAGASYNFTPPSGWAEQTDVGDTTVRAEVALLELTAGATGTISATATASVSAGDGGGGLVIVNPG